LQAIVKFILILGILFIFVGYGTDKLLQTFTGVTYLQGDQVDDGLLTTKTGITVIEYEDHILVKRIDGYNYLVTAVKQIDNHISGGLIAEFLLKVLEVNLSEELSILDIFKLVFAVLITPIFFGIVLLTILKLVFKWLPVNWGFASVSLSLLLLFLGIYQPFIDSISDIRMLIAYDRKTSGEAMEVLYNAVDKNTSDENKGTAIITSIFPSKAKTDEIVIDIGDQLKPISRNGQNIEPPNLLSIINYSTYSNASEKEQKKIQSDQIKHNANEIRKLAYFIYADIEMGEGNSNTQFSEYARELVSLYDLNQTAAGE